MRSKTNSLRIAGATAIAAVLLAGCATHSRPKPDEGKVKQFAGQGYLSDRRYGTTTTLAVWESPRGSLDVAFTVPNGPGPFPLVIYLPALGEGRAAGSFWRSAWAEAGYAAMSFQPLPDDTRAWSSDLARAGEFAALARSRYSGKEMAARIDALGTVLAELRRRRDRKEPPLEQIDPSRVAVIGYDLGAYTAMALAGERIRDAEAHGPPIAVKAVIAISPYADFSGAPFGERYGSIRGPVLSVTSDNDSDPLGVITSPSLRKAPYEYMPAGDKYLLTLWNLPHRSFAGMEPGQELAGESRSPEGGGRSGGASQGGGRGGHRRGGGSMGGATGDDSGGSGGLELARLSPTVQAMDEEAIRSVTTAFLDAYVKDDAIAREWLMKDAPRWIGDRGELQAK